MGERLKKPPLWLVFYWGSQLSGVSLEMGVCVLLGYWGDRRWGTEPWLLITGCVVGFLVSVWHLYQLVRSVDRASHSKSGPPR